MKRQLLMLMAALLLLGGCGYRVPGPDDAWVGQQGETLFIDLFANRTAELYLDNYLTEMVVRELSRSRLFEITEDRQAADLLLTGTVTDFKDRASAYGSGDRIADYSVELFVTARLARRDSGKVLWQDDLQRSENYPATADKNLQLELRARVAREAAGRLAEDLHARLLDAF